MKTGSGLNKPGKPYIVMVHALGYTKSKYCFLPLKKNVKMTLGDARLPSGLWKSIEHMKKSECAKIWIKPGEYGFGRERNPEALQWPDLVKDDEELKQKLRDEEIYYEIELLDWIVRSDILGDGQLMKTYETRGKGLERCGDDDEVIIDYKISKLNEKTEEEEIEQGEDENLSMINYQNELAESKSAHSKALDEKIGVNTAAPDIICPSLELQTNEKFTFVIKRILKTMKLGEKSFTVVQHDWMKKNDPKGFEKYDLKENERLKIDLEFKKVNNIEDFYKDSTTYIKTLYKGERTGSPLSDSLIALNMKIMYSRLEEESKGEVICETTKPMEYALDEYTVPPLLRNIMKTFKHKQKAEIHTILKDEVTPEFDDEENGIFKKEFFEKVGEVDEATGKQRWIVFIVELVAFETPEAMHGLYLEDKIPRLMKMKEVATKFFKAKNWPKACKQYQRMYSHFNLKDIYNNLQKEDEESEAYKNLITECKKIELQSLTNICVVKTKMEDWQDIVDISPKALEIDPDCVKALFFRGKALLNILEYDQAYECFAKILTIDSKNSDTLKELARLKKAKKKYLEKQKAMYSFS